jgi:exosome complex RNA-binding protein Csl4
MGVLYGFCSRCGGLLEQKRNDMNCQKCGNVERRKTASDYGKEEL